MALTGLTSDTAADLQPIIPEPRGARRLAQHALLNAGWLVNVAAACLAGALTGLDHRSALLALVLCACWARGPVVAARGRPAPAAGFWRGLVRSLSVMGVLAVVDEVAATPATEGDLVLAGAVTLLLSWVGRAALNRLSSLASAVPSPRQLVVHGNDLASGLRGLAVSPTARFHRAQRSTVDPVPGIVAEAAGGEVDEVLVLPDAPLSADQVRRLSWQLEPFGVGLRLVTRLVRLTGDRVDVRGQGEALTVDVRPRRLGGAAAAVKGCVERLVALVALLLALPVLLLLMALIRVESHGSPLFRQVRVGKDGRPFTMFKLRTMYVDAGETRAALETLNETEGGVLFKMRADPRVTRVGALLRRSSLDELPQLLNVVRGEMSLVGPRPGLPAEVAGYDETASRRLAVLPGLTGLWQVSGRADLSWQQTVDLDLHYVENWRPALDLEIAARTVQAVVRARGAY